MLVNAWTIRSTPIHFILMTAAATDEPAWSQRPQPLRPLEDRRVARYTECFGRPWGARPVWTTAERRDLLLTRVAVILHERLGNWNRQLRPRLHDRPVRWFETRSRADLDGLLIGLACPVVLIDLGRHPSRG